MWTGSWLLAFCISLLPPLYPLEANVVTNNLIVMLEPFKSLVSYRGSYKTGPQRCLNILRQLPSKCYFLLPPHAFDVSLQLSLARFFHNLFVPSCLNSFSFGQGFFNHRNGNVAWKLQRRSLPCGKNIILDLFFSEIFHGPPSTTWYFYHGQRNTVLHIRSFCKIWLRWLLFFSLFASCPCYPYKPPP